MSRSSWLARLTAAAVLAGGLVVPAPASAADTPPAPTTPGGPLTATDLSDNDAPSGHPEVAAAGDHVYEVWTDFGYDERQIGTVVLRVSDDGGLTWPYKRLVTREWNYSEEPDVTAAGDDVFTVWQTTTGPDDATRPGREVWFQAARSDGRRPEPAINLSTDAADSVDPQVIAVPGWVLVTWKGLNGGVWFAASHDGGRTFSTSRISADAYGGEIAAADGTAYVALSSKDLTTVQVVPVPLVVAQDGTGPVPGAPVTVATGKRLGQAQVAAWGPTVHVIWTDSDDVRPIMEYARSTDRAASWSDPRPMSDLDGYGGLGDVTVDERGLWIASTWIQRDTVVHHSADLGQSFDPAVTVPGVNRGGEARFSERRGATRTEPTPAIDWTMPERYGLDRNDDDIIDQSQTAGYLTPDGFDVVLDGCGSIGGDSPVVRYTWTAEGSTSSTDTCTYERTFSQEGTFPVTLEVTTADGETAHTTQDVVVQDHLVISLGDSVASGEGVPDVPGTGTLGTDKVWNDERCHRSAVAGPSQGAIALERSDPRSSVTFLHLACSGASVMEDIWNGLQISGGGILTPYEGIVMTEGEPLPPQLTQAKELTGGRTPDAVLVSIGANDQKFSSVVKGCITGQCGPGTQLEADFLTRNSRLQNHYDALANQLGDWVDPSRVLLTEYFDPTHDETGGVNLRCVASGPKEVVHDDETQWAFDTVMTRLNDGVRAGVAAHGWHFVGGISDAFTPHGYCAQDGWVVQIGESFAGQGDENGGFHPNRQGHRLYGQRIGAELESLLPAVQVGEAPEPGRADTGGQIHLVTGSGLTTAITPLSASNGAVTAKAPVELPHGGPKGTQDPSAVEVDGGVVVTYVDDQAQVLSGSMKDWEVMAVRVQTDAENLRVRTADLVQGADDATFVVAGRSTAVRAEIVSTLPVTRYVRVGLSAERTADGPVESSSLVALQPGVNVVHLHAPKDLVPSGDQARFAVTVTLDTGHEVDEANEDDNTLTTPSLPVESTRPVKLLFVPLAQPGEEAASCASVTALVDQARPWLQSALPVADGGLTAEVSCALPVQIPTADAETRLTRTLGVLDVMAASSGYDAVVGVARSGWFGGYGGGLSGAVGAALSGTADAPRNGVVVEAGFGGPLVAHEVGHLFGLDHAVEDASGYQVTQRQVKDDLDVMHPGTTDARWVGARTFRALATALNSAAAPAGVAATSSMLVSGVLRADGTFFADDWTPTTLAPSVPLGADGELTLRWFAADGRELGRTGLTPAAGHGAGANEDVTTTARALTARVPVVADAARLTLSAGSTVLVDRTVSANAPGLWITSPSKGGTVAPGGRVSVGWVAYDQDDQPLRFDVDVTGDGGASWLPVARGTTETSASFTVPRGWTGTTFQVRVTATDGLRTTAALAPAFTVQASTSTGLLAMELLHDVTLPDGREVRWNTVWTMKPDGTDLSHVTGDLKFAARPAISPDGRTIALEVAEPRVGMSQIMLMNPDGTNRRILQGQDGFYNTGSCPSWSPDGTQIAFLSGGQIFAVNVDGTNSRLLFERYGTTPMPDGRGAVTWAECPAWSPDGGTIAFQGEREIGDDSIVAMAPDGSNLRVLPATEGYPWSDPLDNYDGSRLDWSPEGELLVDRADGFFAIRADGTGLRKLSDVPALRMAAWSPDGTKLVGNKATWYYQYDVTTMNLDGTDQRNISSFPEDDLMLSASYVDWGPAADGGETPPPAEPGLAEAGGPYAGVEGSPVLLDATGGARPNGDVPAYTWDLDGDGEFDDAAGASVSFVPGDDGDLTVHLRATAADGTTATDDATVTVEDAAPEVTVPAGTAVVGQSFSLPVLATDAGAADTLVADVDWGDGTTSTDLAVVDGLVPDAVHTFSATGSRTVDVRVCDAASGACGSATAVVTVVAKAAPVVRGLQPASGPKGGGSEVVVTGDLLRGATAVRFGTVAATKVTVVSDHELLVTAPAIPAGGAVDVTVVTAGGTSAVVPTARWTALNAAPTVEDVDAVTAVGAAVTLAPVTADPDGDLVTLEVASAPAHGTVTQDVDRLVYTPAAGWSGTERFTVTGTDGTATTGATVTVRVGSAAPRPGDDSLDLTATSAPLGLLLANDSDPDGDPLTVTAVAEPTGVVTAGRIEGDLLVLSLDTAGGTGSIRYTVTDTSGMTATATAWFTVEEVTGGAAPVVATPAGTVQGNEGDTLTASGAFTDPDGGPVTVTAEGPGAVVDHGDGTWTWTLATTDDVAGAVTVTATDAEGLTVTDAVSFAAVNAAPVLDVPVVGAGGCNQPVRLTASARDVGSADVLSTVVDWGDGSTTSVAGGQVDLTHTYARADSWVVTVTVTDDDGASTVQTVSVTTAGGGTRVGALMLPGEGAGRPSSKLGSTLPVKLTVTDCTGAPITTLTPRISLTLVSGTSERAVTVVGASTEDRADGMRWAGEHYLYGLSLKSSTFTDGGALVAGTYRLRVSDPSFSGGPVEALVVVRK